MVPVLEPSKAHNNRLLGDMDVADGLQGGLGWAMRWDQEQPPNHHPAGVGVGLPKPTW